MKFSRFKVSNSLIENQDFDIEGFRYEDISLQSYYFSVLGNIFDPQMVYSQDEIQLILFVIDVEYYLLRKKIRKSGNVQVVPLNHKDVTDIDTSKLENEKGELEKQKNDLEQYLSLRGSVEVNRKKLRKLEESLQTLIKKEEEYEKTKIKFKDVEHLNELDLDKMTEDILKLNKEIAQQEQELLNEKGKMIKSVHYFHRWIIWKLITGSFIIVTSLGWFIIVREVRTVTYFLIPVIGIIFSGYFFITSRMLDTKILTANNNMQVGSVKNIIEHLDELNSRRSMLLGLSKVGSVDEFFELKARYKMLERQIASASAVSSGSGLTVKKVYSEIAVLKDEISNFENHSAVYSNEQDTKDKLIIIEKNLKAITMQLKHIHAANTTSQDLIPSKLKTIVNEMNEQLKNFFPSFSRNYFTLRDKIKEQISKLGVADRFVSFFEETNDILSVFERLEPVDRLILQYLLANNLYNNHYDFYISPYYFSGSNPIMDISTVEDSFSHISNTLVIPDTVKVILLYFEK